MRHQSPHIQGCKHKQGRLFIDYIILPVLHTDKCEFWCLFLIAAFCLDRSVLPTEKTTMQLPFVGVTVTLLMLLKMDIPFAEIGDYEFTLSSQFTLHIHIFLVSFAEEHSSLPSQV